VSCKPVENPQQARVDVVVAQRPFGRGVPREQEQVIAFGQRQSK
jgi:hypothetical protein